MDGASLPPVRQLTLVAVELDGAQLLADSVAYRRDRRKDQVRHENGYLVPRFLAEDVGRELDVVLDAILRMLSHRPSHGTTSGSAQFRTTKSDVTGAGPTRRPATGRARRGRLPQQARGRR